MITLADFQKYESLEQDLKMFLYEKCTEYEEAKCFDVDDFYKYCVLDNEIDYWEFEDVSLKVWIYDSQQEDHYCYTLPLDILFDPDFKLKMKARFDEEREKERLRLLEKRKQHEEEFKRMAEKKRVEEIKMLRSLMEKYPEEVKND